MDLNFFKYWLKGSILEPVISIIIIVVVIGMSLSVLTRFNTATPVKAVNKANEMIQEELYYTLTENQFLSTEFEDGAFTLFKTVVYNAKTGKINLTFEVFDIKKRSIAKRKVILSERCFSGIIPMETKPDYNVQDFDEEENQ